METDPLRRRLAAPEGWVARAGICSAAGGEGTIRSGMAMRKWGAKTLEMGADGRREGSDSEEGRGGEGTDPRGGRASMYAVCVRGERGRVREEGQGFYVMRGRIAPRCEYGS